MSKLQPLSRIARVPIVFAPPSASLRNFGNLLILGDSDVIDITERRRLYTDLESILGDFGQSAPEYLAASVFFSQSPQPAQAYVGRWAASATPAILHGARLSASQQAMSNFVGVGNGGMSITINGSAQNLTGTSLTDLANLNAVASAVTAKLSGATCTWDAINERFDITTTATGAGTKAYGFISFTNMPADGNTFTINGTTITLKTSGATGAQVNIGSTVAETMASIVAYFAAHPITGVTLTQPGSYAARVEANTVGTAGNSITLAKTGANLAVTAATLANGTNAATIGYASAYSGTTDISTLLGLTSSLAQTPVQGMAAETILEAVQAQSEDSTDWYGLYIAATTSITDDSYLGVADFIEGSGITRVMGITTQQSTALAADPTSLAGKLNAAGYSRTFIQYSSDNAHAAASIFGRAFTVDFEGVNTAITIKFKNEPGIAAETLTATQTDNLESINCNVFVSYQQGVNIVEQGVMCSGRFFDEVHGADWLQNRIQTDVVNLLVTNGKILQTDAGVTTILTVIAGALSQAVRNGWLAPGYWQAEGFGDLKYGDYLPEGYYIYATPIRLQDPADRADRKAPSINIAVKLAGAIHSAVIQINVNR